MVDSAVEANFVALLWCKLLLRVMVENQYLFFFKLSVWRETQLLLLVFNFSPYSRIDDEEVVTLYCSCHLADFAQIIISFSIVLLGIC